MEASNNEEQQPTMTAQEEQADNYEHVQQRVVPVPRLPAALGAEEIFESDYDNNSGTSTANSTRSHNNDIIINDDDTKPDKHHHHHRHINDNDLELMQFFRSKSGLSGEFF